jgi:propionate CoA-transferase
MELMTREQASSLIKNFDTVLITGSGGLMEADFVYEAIEKRFLQSGEPNNLTLLHVTGIGNGKEKGTSRFAHKGLVKRVIGGHWFWSPAMIELALNNDIEAYNLPQGVLTLLEREIAAGRKGLFTTLGLKTFVDPRLEGGKINDVTTEDLVELVEVGGEEHLFYKAIPVDVAVIRGSTADEDGNISVEQEAVDLDTLSAAQAAYNSGGIVIAQVKRIAQRKTLNPRLVKVPGFMVDAVVLNPGQWQTSAGEYNPAFSGEKRVPISSIPPLPFDVRKIVARRAAMELKAGMIINLGFGIADGVANVAAEEDIIDHIVFTVEQGIVGGVPAKDNIFGTAHNPDVILDATSQFDFYHGGGLDITFLGMAQIDRFGNVNVSKFGNRLPGCGGFIDISQNAKQVIFLATFTAVGLNVKVQNGKMSILQEGKVKKFIADVEQVTFSGQYASEKKQRVLYVTERAVFRLTESGLELVEIAPGVDLERDILAQMEFSPVVSETLKTMKPAIFNREKMKLIKDL